MNKVRFTSSNKVNDKTAKFHSGDCIAIKYNNGHYLGALISEKFNAYYDFTLLNIYMTKKPGLDDFLNACFFGTLIDTPGKIIYGVDKLMISCKYIDNTSEIELIGHLNLIDGSEKAGYAYIKDLQELLEHYLNEIPIRIEKSLNAKKFPDLAFYGKHLMEMKKITM